jgi:hypothetical protein
MIMKNVLPRPALDRWGVALAAALLCLLALLATPARSDAACTLNAVACENQNTGDDPSTWEINGSGSDDIRGYATTQSVNVGSTINFKIKSNTTNYRVDILRLGYYNGDGARRWATNLVPSNASGSVSQPACRTYSDTGLIDCGNWSVSASWAVPSTAVSGIYIAYLHPTSTTDPAQSSQIEFVVRNDASRSQVLVQTSDATMQAYNTYGGNSLYTCTVACPPGDPAAYKAAYKVSFNRPSTIAVDDGGRSSMFNGAEYPMIRFLERNGYDVSYFSQLDTEERGSLIRNHRLFMSQGHDEYDSANQRAAITAARDSGVNLAFFTANELFWKTRYEPSQDGTNTADRTLVAYKDTHFTSQQDPVAWTGTWRDDRWAAASENLTPENALTGQSFTVNAGTSEIVASAPFARYRIWRNTAVASLVGTQTRALGTDTLGYEWDTDIDNGYRPAGEFDMSSTTVSGVESFTDYGSSVAENTTQTHSLTMYKAASGARVFNTGTVQWSWGLDDQNVWGYAADPVMQQATINILADLSAQPATLMSGMSSASASTDTTAPVPSLRSYPTTATDGSNVTVSGSATDSGGQVAGVEVSTDGGSTWHPANGTTSWSYTFVIHGSPTSTIKVRAVDDSGNLSAATSGVNITVNCPCSLFGDNIRPDSTGADAGDPTPVELGMKFKSDTYGTVSAIRFYKSAANTGTHTGSLWAADGTRLAQVTFTGETSSGWQTANLSTPVAILPNTTYVVSYFAPSGHYSATQDYFYRTPAPGPSGGSVADSAPLHALRSGGTSSTSTTNGLYNYGGTSGFPTLSSNATNYWVDVKFSATPAPGTATGVTATAAGRTSADVRWTAPATGGAPTSYKITPYVGTTAQTALAVTTSAPATSKTVTGLTNGTTYTFTVTASNPAGDGPASARSNTVTPLTAVIPTAPLTVRATPATQQAQVTWTAPQSDGDSALTNYVITPYIGSTAQATTTVSAASTSANVTGLTDGSAYTFKVQAVNGVGTGPASTASDPVTPQATLFDLATPTAPDAGDTSPVEVGTKFKADFNGTITGVRFYKAAANTGQHIGTLWSATGTRLAQVTFTNETDSGWQSATFASPVSVTAGTTYVVSYFAPSGHYSASSGALSSPVDNGMLHTIADSVSANGVFSYTGTGGTTFPAGSYTATSYGVDVLYAVPVPGTVTGVTGTTAGPTSVTLSWTAPSSGGPVANYRITPYIGTTAQASTTTSGSGTTATVTGLTTGTGYTFTVAAQNPNGAGTASARSATLTPNAPQAPGAPTGVSAQPATTSARVSWTAPSSDGGSAITGYTVTPYDGGAAQAATTVSASATAVTVNGLTNGKAYTFKVKATNNIGDGAYSAASAAVTPDVTVQDFATPATIDSGDTNAVGLGVKFQTDFTGQATGIRFYKAAANTGTHIGYLWSAAGVNLAQVTFTNESASGWQSATFASPVTLTAGTTYVASYYAPNGHYSVTAGGLSSGKDNAPLHALADSVSPNGVFAYGAAGLFPNGSFNAGDYGVDVLFDPARAPGAPTGVTATAGSGSATVSWTAPSSGGPVTSYKITPYIGSTAQTATTITGAPPATTKTIGGLSAGTSYTFKVSAANPTGSSADSAASAAVTPGGASAPGTPTGVTATSDAGKVTVAWTAPSSDGGSALTGYRITPYAGSTAQTPVDVDASNTTADITGLTKGTDYTFTVAAVNAAGTGTASAASATATPLFSIFENTTPATADAGDGSAITVGLKFTADRDGSVAGVRFYKAAANTGTHIGALWATDSTLLRSATFTGETSSGWQSVLFSTPVAVTAGTTYIVSYLAPNGHYAAAGGAFSSSPTDNPPLHALADFTSANGVFHYGTSSAFPSDSWNATNYWVDVLFD